jgi:hypothetical protein
MEKRTAMLVVVLAVTSMFSSVALALPPMGPPRATAGQDQWTIGAEYGRGEMDLETSGDVQEVLLGSAFERSTDFDIDGLESNMFFANLSYGIHDSWDVFVRLGAADGEGEIDEDPGNGGAGDTYTGMDGSLGFAWGIGTRATFWEDGDVTWGGLFQATWLDPDGSDVDLKGDPAFSGDADLDFWEIQIAAGPTVEYDNFRVYGGPFLHFVGGDLDISGQTVDQPGSITITMTASQDIEEESIFGGYVGAQWLMAENATCNVEFQATGDAWAIGVGAIWKFE